MFVTLMPGFHQVSAGTEFAVPAIGGRRLRGHHTYRTEWSPN